MKEQRKRKSRATSIQETNLGMYLWMLPSGDLLADNEGNFLNIPSYRHDIQRMSIITQTARNLGFDGSPVFYEGGMRVTEEEYYKQLDRFLNGQIPNELDVGNYKDDVRQHGKR